MLSDHRTRPDRSLAHRNPYQEPPPNAPPGTTAAAERRRPIFPTQTPSHLGNLAFQQTGRLNELLLPEQKFLS